jgi:hypothetical protein
MLVDRRPSISLMDYHAAITTKVDEVLNALRAKLNTRAGLTRPKRWRGRVDCCPKSFLSRRP